MESEVTTQCTVTLKVYVGVSNKYAAWLGGITIYIDTVNYPKSVILMLYSVKMFVAWSIDKKDETEPGETESEKVHCELSYNAFVLVMSKDKS